MKKIFSRLAVFGAALLVLGACSSDPQVSRIDANTQRDLSGEWNDTDVRLVCDTLIRDALLDPMVDRFVREYSAVHNGSLPAVTVKTFKNATSEHGVDTAIISRLMRNAIISSRRLDFVADGEVREEIRAERQDQQTYASEDTAARLGNETGAILALNGEVRSMVDRAGNRSVRSYFVSATLTNMETGRILWAGENNEIKKDIRQSKARF